MPTLKPKITIDAYLDFYLDSAIAAIHSVNYDEIYSQLKQSAINNNNIPFPYEIEDLTRNIAHSLQKIIQADKKSSNYVLHYYLKKDFIAISADYVEKDDEVVVKIHYSFDEGNSCKVKV